jgi:putative SOS response-associated peptidase YedK
MCGRFGQTKKIANQDLLQDVIVPGLFQENFNVSPGNNAYILTQNFHFEKAVFGFTPHWEKQARFYFNARAEGKENPQNQTEFSGPYGIFQMPSFREAIRKNRCLIPVDYFIEGPEKEKLSQPYLIERKDGNCFFLGGIYSDFVDTSTGEISRTFAIITTASSRLVSKIGHHRSPLLIENDKMNTWMDLKINSEEILKFFVPFDSKSYHAFRISPAIKSPNRNHSNNSPLLIQPTGEIISLD